ncbi:MAG: DUF3090 domain-containing protein [Chloroflexi bacterium]|nr:DUF3090 domain-containing protein [Chloroflexota bacterium]
MARDVLDLNPVSRITVDAVGTPGRRVFYLQARQGRTLVSVICEKEQIRALARSIDEMLTDLGRKNPDLPDPQKVLGDDMTLEEPIEPRFRAGQVGLGYDEGQDLIVMVVQELQEEGSEDQPAVVRLWATRGQMQSLAYKGMEAVNAGRPICPLCGRPIDPAGHFCPQRNGHNKALTV